MYPGIDSVGQNASLIGKSITSKMYSAMKKHDKDGSGGISKDEFKGSDKAFSLLDKNQDGQIDSADFESMSATESEDGKNPLQKLLEGIMGDFIKSQDQDGDNRLSAEEFGSDEKTFQRIDRDGDGYVTAQELADDLLQENPELALQTDIFKSVIETALKPQEEKKEIRSIARETFEKTIESLDSDEDKALSKEEINVDEKTFNQWDHNGDGLITADELTESFMDEYQISDNLFAYDNLQMLVEFLSNITQSSQKEDSQDSANKHIDVKG